MRWIQAFVLLTVALVPFRSFSSENLVVFRKPSGEFSAQSRENAKAIHRIASESGYVTLSLMLKYPYDVHAENDDPEYHAQQNDDVKRQFKDLLRPYVQKGEVWLPKNGAYFSGPSTIVRASAKGFRGLVKDDRIAQIVAMGGQSYGMKQGE
ncbi:MAG: hypothetical protein AAFX44_05195 [Pseudomonadota bacterium]